MTTKKWIQKAHIKPGALHRQLGYGEREKIPTKMLQRIVKTQIGNKTWIHGGNRTVTKLMKSRANFALNVRG